MSTWGRTPSWAIPQGPVFPIRPLFPAARRDLGVHLDINYGLHLEKLPKLSCAQKQSFGKRPSHGEAILTRASPPTSKHSSWMCTQEVGPCQAGHREPSLERGILYPSFCFQFPSCPETRSCSLLGPLPCLGFRQLWTEICKTSERK